MATPILPPINKDSPISDLHIHLQDIINNINPPTSTLAIYDHIASFYSGKEKTNSINGWPGHKDNKTFADFLNFKIDDATTRIGLFTTFNQTWVGAKVHWSKIQMHAWVGIVANTSEGKGKVVVFWDSNAKEYLEKARKKPKFSWKTTLAGGQKRFLERCKDRKINVKEIWLGGLGNEGKEDCLKLSLDWMKEMVKVGKFEVEKLKDMGFEKF